MRTSGNRCDLVAALCKLYRNESSNAASRHRREFHRIPLFPAFACINGSLTGIEKHYQECLGGIAPRAANVGNGSFSTGTWPAVCPAMSAAPPKAEVTSGYCRRQWPLPVSSARPSGTNSLTALRCSASKGAFSTTDSAAHTTSRPSTRRALRRAGFCAGRVSAFGNALRSFPRKRESRTTIVKPVVFSLGPRFREDERRPVATRHTAKGPSWHQN
jgi:hypothetical protein